MQVSYLRGMSVEVPEVVMDVFIEWFSLWEGRLHDDYDGETYRAAFALGYEVGLRNLAGDVPPKRNFVELDDWSIPHGNC